MTEVAAPPIATERSASNGLLQTGAPDCVALFGTPGLRSRQHALAAAAIDIDEAPDLADRYRITAVPSLLLCGGKVLSRRLGEIDEPRSTIGSLSPNPKDEIVRRGVEAGR